MLEMCHFKNGFLENIANLGELEHKLNSWVIFLRLLLLKWCWFELGYGYLKSSVLMQGEHIVENPNSRSTIDNVYLFLACITKFWQEVYIRNYISLWLMLK